MTNTNTTTINVTAIAFTGYPVTDMPRARAFYEGVLGLKTGEIWEMGEGKAWVEYDIGAGTIAITNSAPQWKPSSDGPAVALEVVDFDAAIAALRAANTSFFLEPTESPVCHLAIIRDPDGNTLAIHRRKRG